VQRLHVVAGGHALHRLPADVERVRGGDQGQQAVLLHGVVEHALLAAIAPGREALSPHRGVADGDGAGSAEGQAAGHHDRHPHVRHGRVGCDLPGRQGGVLASGTEGGVLHGHVGAWDAHAVEAAEAVVLVVVTNLGADVAHRDARKRPVRFQVTDLDHKIVDADVSPIKDEARVDDRVVGSPAQRARPPFGARRRGAVYLELVALRQVRGRGLEGPHVAAVAKLSLSVAAQHLPRLGTRKPVRLLLLRKSRSYVRQEHQILEIGAQLVVHRGTHGRPRHLQLSSQLDYAALLLHAAPVAPGPVQAIEIGVCEHWFLLHGRLQHLAVLRGTLAAPEEVRHLPHRERGPSPLGLQRRLRHGSLPSGRAAL